MPYDNVTEQVLDGQQRLSSLREMLDGLEYYVKINNINEFAKEDYDSSNIVCGGVVRRVGKKYANRSRARHTAKG